MAQGPVTLTRQQLYEKVWSAPSTKLAEEFGFSDVALAKLCRKHRVPKPPLGYWARVQHGQTPKRPALPAVAKETDKQIVIRGRTTRTPAPKPPRIALRTGEAFHPLVLQTERELREGRKDSDGLCWRRPNSGLDVAVGEAHIDRALLILDSLVKHLDGCGYTVSVLKNDSGGKTIATIDDERIGFRVRQKMNSPFFTLSLEVEYGVLYRSGIHTNFSEHPKRSLESLLTSFVGGMRTAAAWARPARIRHFEHEREWEARKKAEAAREQRRREEKALVERLRATFQEWTAQRGRELFIAELERQAASADNLSDKGQWLLWAKDYAAKHDKWAEADKPPPMQSHYSSKPDYAPWWYVLHHSRR